LKAKELRNICGRTKCTILLKCIAPKYKNPIFRRSAALVVGELLFLQIFRRSAALTTIRNFVKINAK